MVSCFFAPQSNSVKHFSKATIIDGAQGSVPKALLRPCAPCEFYPKNTLTVYFSTANGHSLGLHPPVMGIFHTLQRQGLPLAHLLLLLQSDWLYKHRDIISED